MNGDDIIKLACKGNVAAESFCRSWVTFCHALDDCVDADKALSADAITDAFVGYTIELACNPFFLANKAQLFGLMIQSANAWRDAERFRFKGYSVEECERYRMARDCAERDVLKGFYHEVVFHCAFIIGGWAHLRRVTQECREYDFERMGA